MPVTKTFSAALAASCILLCQQADALISSAPYFYRTDRPLLVAHRGTYGKAPEHSLASYIDAYYAGADFLELDVELSKDGYLVLQHDPAINDDTNIQEYAELFADKQHDDGKWYVQDFTLAELKTLKRKQRYQTMRSPLLNDRYDFVTLSEVIENVQMLEQDAPRRENAETKVGLYIEVKEYDDKKAEGIDLSELIFEELTKYGLGTIDDCKDSIPIVIQCFQSNGLIKMQSLTDLPRVQLIEDFLDYDYEAVSKYAHGVGPSSEKIQNSDDPNDQTFSNYIAQMHSLDMAVHPWEIQDDDLKFQTTVYDETEWYINKGVDGIFVEFPHAMYALFQHFGTKANFPNLASGSGLDQIQN